jgi:hypothetical protein
MSWGGRERFDDTVIRRPIPPDLVGVAQLRVFGKEDLNIQSISHLVVVI